MSTTTTKLKLEAKIEQIIAELRPMLMTHGGDVKLLNVTKNNIVELEFQGACVGCELADQTLNLGLKEAIMLQCEEVTDVKIR